jgi:hypothetical protein
MNEPADLSKEKRILRTMRFMLAQIIKETAVPAGMRHPLSKGTIEDMRNCLVLIAAREHELAQAAGRPSAARPRYKDQTASRGKVVVPLPKSGLDKKTPKPN